MRLGKSLVTLTAVLLLGSAGMASAAVSLVDTLWIINPTGGNEIRISNNIDTNFYLAVMVDTDTSFGAITIPLKFAGLAELNIDTTVVSGTEKGITYGPAGRKTGWNFNTSQVNNTNKTILIGLTSFGVVAGPLNDSLVYVHFELKSSGQNVRIPVDTALLPPANQLSMTTVIASEFTPQWRRCDIRVGTVSDVDDAAGVKPLTYGLDQNFPNPFNAQTQISFSMPKADHVKLVVFNMLGQQVRTLVDKSMQAGEHKMIWDGFNAQGTGVASGTYFYRLKIGDVFEETRQMVLLK